jgi:hypothetical protein
MARPSAHRKMCLGSTFVRISTKRLAEVKLKFTLEQATKVVRRSRGIAVLDVHGFVHLGNVYVQLKVQLYVLFIMYSLFLSVNLAVLKV